MNFRRATILDARLLYDWRNDPATRENSISRDRVDYETHLAWLEQSLADPARRIFIVEDEAGVSVGTIRVDGRQDGGEGKVGAAELSWTVSPDCRGKGLGKAMLLGFVRLHDGAYTAQIKARNLQSMKIAGHAGFAVARSEGGIIYLKRARGGA
ncbi:MAG: N-acetyltransferase [Alphaproteobacteria bacterium HGW-Alphaproteobacteria-12]|nr:MAG: N-acetyltransferase [Alphaproteobacteria bacterium HGW-Alphaproteobacteria-12]